MKHAQLVPSLHSKNLNPNIAFEKSPFYIQQVLSEWPRPVIEKAGKSKECPRIACISSFGAGGANAHAVIEEFPQPAFQPTLEAKTLFPYVVPLSAGNMERLQVYAENLLQFVRLNKRKVRLADLAYTLQTGREDMGMRLGLIVPTMESLEEKLEHFIAGKSDVSGVFVGKIEQNKKSLIRFALDEDLNRMIASWTIKGKYQELLDLWVQGLAIDWQKLFGNANLRRISAPLYPFSKERYWANGMTQAVVSEPLPLQSQMQTPVLTTEAPEAKEATLLRPTLFVPAWRPAPYPEAGVPAELEKQVVFFCGFKRKFEPQPGHSPHLTSFHYLDSEHPETGKRLEEYALQLFQAVQQLLSSSPEGNVMVQVVIPDNGDDNLSSCLSGLLKTAHHENPRFFGQIIEVGENDAPENLFRILTENAQLKEEKEIRYVETTRYAKFYHEIMASTPNEALPWKDGGVYLITGGAGGLGLIFAKEIASKTREVSLILIGRSALNQDQKDQLRALNTAGAKVTYESVDIADAAAVNARLLSIQTRYGQLNGIIHSAGLIRDQYILRKQAATFRQVLAPKLSGTLNLDWASRDFNLDFFVCFSSCNGVTGNLGQADYATASAFLDAFAAHRNKGVQLQKKKGHTLSIDWPLWKDGGMQVDADTEARLARSGIFPMESGSGLAAFYAALASKQDQVMVINGGSTILTQMLDGASAAPEQVPQTATLSEIDPGVIREKTLVQLKSLFAAVTKINPTKIDPEEAMESYGIDSILIYRLNQKLEAGFVGLSKTLFYEFQTLAAVAGYLATQYPDACIQWCGLAGNATQASAQYSFSAPPEPQPESQKPGVREAASGNSNSSQGKDPIAIIGMSGMFPGAKDLSEFWENLKSGKDSIVEVPNARWEMEGFYHPDKQEAIDQGKSYCKWGGFLDGFDEFDPLFFNISPREAMDMDPQERLFLQSCWKAVEDAGYSKATLATRFNGKVGVFAGITKTGFELHGPALWKQGKQMFPRTSFSSVANRVSYALNLNGPSLPIDTMCSSSITAIHEACEHLRRNSCEMAIAGAVNLYLHPSNYVGLSAYRMLSTDGRCKAFGQGANGFVPGEGVGVVLLKKLEQAIADKDPIYAVIRSSSVNHDGKTNGYTVPNPNAQRNLIRTALEEAGINARELSYIEAHGTGTDLGDPIEITALTQAFQKDTADTGFCAIGSVKSNIGHLEAAAGMAGLFKVLLQMQHKTLVPTLHTAQLNANIQFQRTPFVVQRELAEWKRPVIESAGESEACPRIAGISSFGAGGANAHMILEEYLPGEPPREQSGTAPIVIVLSAKTKERLHEYAAELLKFILKDTSVRLEDLAYTLQIGREPMEKRMAILVESAGELEEKLRYFIAGNTSIGEVYAGQSGAIGEGTGLFSTDEDFKNIINTWIDKGKLSKVAESWVNGADVNWQRLYHGPLPRRISAPTYPFAKERYWFDAADVAPQEKKSEELGGAPANQEPGKEVQNERQGSDAGSLWFAEEWISAAIDLEKVPWTDKLHAKKDHRVLVISEAETQAADFKKVCHRLASFMQQPGPIWEVEHLKHPFGPGNRVDEPTLATHLKPSDAPLAIFLLLPKSKHSESFDSDLECVFCLIQSLLVLAAAQPIRLYCCYDLQQLEKDAYREGLSGLMKAAMMESLDHRYRSIAFEGEGTSATQLALHLVQEWLNDETEGLHATRVPMVRYREGARLELRLSEARGAWENEPRSAFRKRATYLIVGGLGEVGELLCQELGRNFQAQLIVLSRRPEVAVRESLNRIRAAGATVIYRSVDILDLEALQEVMKSISDEGLQIQGVIHLARLVSDAPIVKKSYEAFRRVMAAKVQGTVNIDAATAMEPLEFFLVFSSMAAFGIKGSPDYAYSTAFQNAWVRQRNRLLALGKRNGRACAICWGQWGRDGGVDPQNMGDRMEKLSKLGIACIDVPASIGVMAKCLSHSDEVVGFVAVNSREKVLQNLGFEEPQSANHQEIYETIDAFENGEIPKSEFIAFLKTLDEADYTEPIREKILQAISLREEVQSQLRELSPPEQDAMPKMQAAVPNKAPFSAEIPLAKASATPTMALDQVVRCVAKVLQLNPSRLSHNQPLQDFGLDSIAAMQLATILEKEFQFQIPPGWLIEYPTINSLAAKLNENIKTKLISQ